MTRDPPDQPAETDTTGSGSIELAPGVVVAASTVRVSYSSSSGPGGQNVNRRATRAQLRLAVEELPVSPAVRRRLVGIAKSHLTSEGELLITSDEHRSQRRNRGACLDRLRLMLIQALRPPVIRRPTRPTRGSIERRLDAKRQRGQTKRRRQTPED